VAVNSYLKGVHFIQMKCTPCFFEHPPIRPAHFSEQSTWRLIRSIAYRCFRTLNRAGRTFLEGLWVQSPRGSLVFHFLPIRSYFLYRKPPAGLIEHLLHLRQILRRRGV